MNTLAVIRSGSLHQHAAITGSRENSAERAELLKLWDGLDAEAQKGLIFVARGIARGAADVTEGPPDATGDEGE